MQGAADNAGVDGGGALDGAPRPHAGQILSRARRGRSAARPQEDGAAPSKVAASNARSRSPFWGKSPGRGAGRADSVLAEKAKSPGASRAKAPPGRPRSRSVRRGGSSAGGFEASDRRGATSGSNGAGGRVAL